MRKLSLLISIFVLSLVSVSAQIRTFSSEPEAFLSQVNDMFSSINKQEAETFMLEFTEAFNSFSPELQKEIIATGNQMHKKRMQPSPDFYNYFNSLVLFAGGAQTEESFNAWRTIIRDVSTGQTRKFSEFLKITMDLLYDNVLYQTSAIRWQSSGNNFKFLNDTAPAVQFTQINLTGYAKGDSTVIYETSGVYLPLEEKWIGSKGRLEWVRSGISADSAWAELNNYEISLRSPQYEIDSVVFYNKKYFTEPLLGRLEEKVLANATPQNASYPRFASYQQEFTIRGIIPGVDYQGGFSQEGAQFIGSGTAEDPASLLFYRKDTLQLKAQSKVFVIRDDRIITQLGAVTIYLEDDSIYHPGLEIKLISNERQLSLFRDKKGVSMSPYFNTFHQLDMDFEQLLWNLDEPMMNFQVIRGSSQTQARFESANFYSSVLYRKLLHSANENPLLVLHDAARAAQSDVLYGEDIAIHWRLPMSQVEPMLIVLSNLGFITYNPQTKKTVIKQKLYDYILANGRKKDYDVIAFDSDIAGRPNATLSLLNFDLTIRGVNSILLSDSQRVIVSPRNGEIVMSKNRNFKFAGQVESGMLEFRGKEFAFNYDDFKIELTNVDSMIVIVQVGEPDEMGRIPVRRLKTAVQQVQGEIAIDSPGNKSGLKDLGQYPILTSSKESFVYYDGRSIQNGAYDRDRFYFKVDPFTLDSMDNFSSAGLEMEGTFSSGGIFPDFREKLMVQPDYSLGFLRKTPEGGMPAYEGKATFSNEIRMSHEGLRGNGDFKYLHSLSTSDDFIFYPDSMNGIASSHTQDEITSGTEFPKVTGTNVLVHYVPDPNHMAVSKTDQALAMFGDNAEMHNTLFLSPGGLTGTGNMKFKGAEMDADLYTFKSQEIFSDTANFRLAALESADFAFKTNNVNSHIDFTRKIGHFKSNGGGSFVEFPINQYRCFMDQFTWNMEKDDIELSAGNNAVTTTDPTNSGLDLSGSKFVSTHPDQDSLTFYAPSAKYDIRNHIISARGVKFFNVADAMIYPHEGDIVIEKKAVMQTLEDARLLANFVTQYHNIYDASINVYGKRSYTGSGKYDYVNELQEIQTIHLHTVATDSTAQTYGKGSIAESMGFMLSPRFGFRGDFNLIANNPFLVFDGLTRITHVCASLAQNWMKFKAEIDPNEIYIPVDSMPVNEAGNAISNGLILAMDSVRIYSTFLSGKQNRNDKEIITASGFLFFDKQTQEYKIAGREKLGETSLPGNYVALNTGDCKTYAEGQMDFGGDLGQVVLEPVGSAYHNLNDNSLVFDLVLPVDFFFDNSAMDKMADMLNQAASAEGVDNSREVYEKALRELVGKEEADKLISQIGLYGNFRRMPSALEHTLLFTDLKMKWDAESQSYRSVGNIGIGSIGKTQINKKVKGYIELQKKRSGDVLNIYLELDGGVWYFFTYTRSVMQAISSSSEFNTIIAELKPDKRRMNVNKGEAQYAFMPSTESKKKQFIRRMEPEDGEVEE